MPHDETLCANTSPEIFNEFKPFIYNTDVIFSAINKCYKKAIKHIPASIHEQRSWFAPPPSPCAAIDLTPIDFPAMLIFVLAIFRSRNLITR